MNPVYSHAPSGVPYANPKGISYPAGFPVGYAAAAPAYSPNIYPGANPAFQTGHQAEESLFEAVLRGWNYHNNDRSCWQAVLSFKMDQLTKRRTEPSSSDSFCYTPGTPYKMSCSPTSGTVPPYSSSPNPYQTTVYPVRSPYPQQNPYAQQGTYYTQPLYGPHVIHHTTVVQPNGMPAAMYPPAIPPPRANSVTMGMLAGTTMALSAVLGTLLTHSPTPVAPHAVTMPTYRPPGTPTYSYVPTQW
uniref:Family with sequence similarity 168 member B n=1 Tax=Latimeria chalumnae TaxID=7897 RepID=H3BEL4_LATCH